MTQPDADALPQSAPLRILVVEDEPLIRFVIAETLRDLQAAVVEAATADEAWEYLTTGASVDLVFTDHRMPGRMTGAELARLVGRQYPAIEVIVTSSADVADPEWAGPVLPKPYKLFETATNLVEMALRNRRTG